MAYVTLDDLRGPDGYLDQQFSVKGEDGNPTGEPDESHDVALQAVLDRAEAFVNSYIDTPSSLAAAVNGPRVIYGSGTRRLALPVLTAGSVTLVSAPSGYTVPDYIEQDGYLVTTDSNGILYPDYPVYRPADPFYGGAGVWAAGVPYTVTATFGWNTADMAVLAEATLQTAVQLWRYKDTGGSETIGAEGAITTVRAGWTPLVKQGLDGIKARLKGGVGGVW